MALYIVLSLLAGLAIGLLASRALGAGELSRLRTSAEVEHQRSADLEKRLGELAARDEKARGELAAQYKENLEQLRQQQREQLDHQLQLVSEQLRTASENALRSRQQQLNAANAEQMAAILAPLNQNIKSMREAVEHSKMEQTKTMTTLEAAIKTSFDYAKAVGESADRLASALTGENKAQGNFGELKLKELLDSMGLTEGLEYETQATLRDAAGNALKADDTGRRMIPDVVLHFPDKRDMVIDSKMSFKAFEDYQSAADSAARSEALRRHIESVRSHVRELSAKDYSKYLAASGGARLDFVIMYVFSEGALQLALSNDATLWRDAYDKGVLITGSQNMYALLRILEISWRQMRQVENQQKIMAAASDIVGRVQMLCERLDKADECLQKTQQAFSDVRLMAAPSGRSITTAARRLISFGASKDARHKPLPEDGDGEAEG